ncbi:MAG: ThuA domain-containing protein, partial [Pseudoxanthomonas sp.]
MVVRVLCCAAISLTVLLGGCARQPEKKIVLIGGPASEGPGRHEYDAGVGRIRSLLEATAQSRGFRVVTFEKGWPDDPAVLEDASTLVLYFDGLDKHPLRDAGHRRQFEALMQRGVGLVALHQASTVPPDDSGIGMQRWLGAERVGMFDRTTETATLQPVAAAHPVSRGIDAFAYRDEFYPTLRFAAAGVVPVLRATLHVQYRNGASVMEDQPETSTVAWAYERPSGGRSFGYSGAHYLAALDQPMLRKTLLNAIFWTAGIDVPQAGADATLAAAPVAAIGEGARTAHADAPTFHADRQRSGWHSRQLALTPASVAGSSFGPLWESPQLDSLGGQPPRLYASPLYLDRVRITAGQHQGQTFSAVFAASNNGFVYAINAAKAGDVAPGRILWRKQLAQPCRLQPAPLDAVPTGVLSTPIIDIEKGRLYVTHCDPQKGWQAYALDIGSGELLKGWPVRLDEARFNAVNRNAGPAPVAPTRRFDFRVQRGALNLSPDGTRLYATFGETETGWLVSIDTAAAKVDSAFAAVAMPHRGSGGIWGAGGPAVDAQGNVFVVTGSGFEGYLDQPADWTQSVLKLSDSPGAGLKLQGTYTPFNHCTTAKMDIDLGSGGASLLADLETARTSTPRLMVVGGKQGNAYLLDRDRLPGRLDRRPACGGDAASDGSLLAPTRQPQFAGRGPLNVFGPYSEHDAAMDVARARSVPAYYRDAKGDLYAYLTGNSKRAEGSADSVPPSLVRLKVVATPGQPAYLRVDRKQQDLVLGNPGSPVISSKASSDAIVWILDENARRSAPLAGPGSPAPVLYALDAVSLKVLWKSAAGQLHTSGKYNEPVFAGDQVVVGTDRLQVFGTGASPAKRPAAATANAAPPPLQIALADSGLDGAALYRQRCAMCHDHPQGNIPPRQLIASHPHSR